MPRLALLLVVFVLVGASTATAPAGAAAVAKPCWERVIDDWLDNGTVDGTYGVACYEAALRHVPEDLREYSDITAAISVALQSTLRPSSSSGSSGPDQTGGGASKRDDSTASTAKRRGVARTRPRSLYRRGVDNLGTTSAQSVPVALIVLGGLGGALLIIAAGLALRKRLKAP